MSEKWDRQLGHAVVYVLRLDSDGYAQVRMGEKYTFVRQEALSNLPTPPRALTKAEAALVDRMVLVRRVRGSISVETAFLADAVIAERAPVDPNQALKDAVVEAVAGWRRGDGSAHVTLAHNALLAAQRPPSAYAGLRAAWDALAIRHGMIEGVADIRDELAKLESEDKR